MRRLAALLFPFALATAAPSQTAAPIPPPVLPLLAHYSFWPTQFVQFVGPELPYAMITLEVDPGGKQPLLYLTLTDRATGKRVHYTDNDGLVAAATGLGEEVHKTALAYEPADTENPGSVTTVRLTMADGKPLQWRFVQGSDISEQGSGLNPFPGAKFPIFAYREQGAVAGEGTALQIGDTVSTAAVWTEISHPPYFVGYRGAVTESAHTLVFSPGKESWTIASAPSALAAGATWELDEAHGNHRSIRIDKVDGQRITVTSTDRFTPRFRCTFETTRAGDVWSMERVRFAPVREGDKHSFSLEFGAPLLSTAASDTTVTITVGKKTTIADGAITSSGTGAERTLKLSFSHPAWLNGTALAEELSVSPQGFGVSAHP